MKPCEDCGTRLVNNICGNCQEELAIIDRQGECIDFPLSDDFVRKARRQEDEVRARRH